MLSLLYVLPLIVLVSLCPAIEYDIVSSLVAAGLHC
jgi:hypothetical protein